MKKNVLFIFSDFLISSIELLCVIIPQYVYACDICYYPII